MALYSPDITPDSLSGAILAAEGIRDAAVLLNGPTGCKFYHGAISHDQFPRDASFDPLDFRQVCYFGQPRVPATYLDGYDYVYGAGAKLAEILPLVAARGYRLVVVVNSPGAALIGDDLPRLVQQQAGSVPCVVLESTGFSGSFAEGFRNALLGVLERLTLNGRRADSRNSRSINLVGISIYHKHWAGNIAELKRLLAACGIGVTATLCAGDRVRDLKKLPEAACSVVLYPEYGAELGRWLEEHCGVPCIIPPGGLPIGFEATEHFLKTVAGQLEADVSPALALLEMARANCFRHLARFHSMTGLPGGSTFAVRANPATADALTRWLSSYLGLVPVAVELTEGDSGSSRRLSDYLQETELGGVLGRPAHATAADLVFGDGNTIALAQLHHGHCCGIEIALPSLGYLDVTEKALFGASGASLLVEQIVNALHFLSARQQRR
jgi:nitrogenase molybdenum-iron protein alpha/beta subunit